MNGLPKRFPRAALIERASLLELAIETQLDITFASMQGVSPGADHIRFRKYDDRYKILEAARYQCNQLRLTLWQLQ